jgi:hypothetical protein
MAKVDAIRAERMTVIPVGVSEKQHIQIGWQTKQVNDLGKWTKSKEAI